MQNGWLLIRICCCCVGLPISEVLAVIMVMVHRPTETDMRISADLRVAAVWLPQVRLKPPLQAAMMRFLPRFPDLAVPVQSYMQPILVAHCRMWHTTLNT